MVIIVNSNGDVVKNIPENIYQGSNNANSIVVLAPFASSSQLTIAYRLPDGVLTEPALMTPYEDVPSEYDLSGWYINLDEAITEKYGNVDFQVRATTNTDTVIASFGFNFTVLRGVAPILPPTPSQSIYEQILTALASIQADIVNGWLESKGLLPYDETFTYSLNTVLYDNNTFYKSKIPDNIANPLTDTDSWEEILFATEQEVADLIQAHNISETAHNDIRLILAGLIDGTYPIISCANVSDTINNVLITEIFESDGKTAKTATNAINDASGNNIEETYQTKANLVSEFSATPLDTKYPSEKLVKEYVDESVTKEYWSVKTWNGLNDFFGFRIWTDGDNIYYSEGTNQYVLDKATSTWSVKTWVGLTNFSGQYIWKDGDNIYYSYDTSQYVLDKTTSTWSVKTWNGLSGLTGDYIWTDGDNIYYSSISTQYVLDTATSTWSVKTWTGLTSFVGSGIWTDGDNIYYSLITIQYVLDKATSTWSVKTWVGIGLNDFYRDYIWTDGDNIYYSNNTSQYVLDKATSTWSVKTWVGLTSFFGSNIWTDGDNIYYSFGTSQYVLGGIVATLIGIETLTNKTLTDPIINRIKNGTNYLSVPTLSSDEVIATLSDIPTQASDIGALPDTTKYGTTIDLTYTALTGELQLDLKDQDGTTLSTETVDLPMELIITSGSVETCTIDDEPVVGYVVGDKYIDLVLANGEHLYILASDFIDQITITETGTGNAVTDISINGSVLTETKGKTFVETNRKVAGKALTEDITLASSDLTDSANLIKGATIYGGTISSNLDTETKNGFYTFYSNAVGSPFTSSGFMQHENSNVGTVSATQKAVAYDGTDIKMVVRVKTNSTWGAWVKITTEKDTQTYTTTLPTTSGGTSDWQAVTGGYELAKTISGLTVYDSIVSVADDDTIWTDNELNATITTDTLTFFVSSLPSAEVGLTLTITKSINGGTI